MNNLTSFTNQTMSSLEIAQLCEKEHSKVTSDIERILSEVQIDHAIFRVIEKDSLNRNRIVYHLPRRECDLVVSSYVAKYRLAIIDRWQALEEQNRQLLPQTHIQAVEAYLATLKQVEAQQKQLGM